MQTMSVYSYHTFILPFVWEGTQAHRHTMEEFAGCFRENPNWVCTDMPDEYDIRPLGDNKDVMLLYKEYQYFHPFVRKAIYGFGENIVANFSFMPDKMPVKGHYYITKGNRTYDLILSGVKLKIFNTGIALFIMECENRGVDADGNPQNDLESVKDINDYGRRISLPFIPASEDDYSACADRLCVEVEGMFRFEDDYRAFIRQTNEGGALSSTPMCGLIKNILGYGSLRRFTSKRSNEEQGKLYIYPALDDRMVVCCLVNDSVVTQDMLAFDGEKYAYETDEVLSESLYELMFVDHSGGCSCPTPQIRLDLVDSHLYKRWFGKGQNATLYGIVTHGLMMLSDSPPDHLVDSFLTQYIQMTCLALAQRATLIHFQREASILSADIEKTGRSINRATILQLMNLQERCVAYKSQLYFTELTPQEQGVELYDMLREVMFIERESQSLDNHMESLSSAAETNLDFGFNKIAVIFTWISCILAVMQNVICFFTVENAKEGFVYVKGGISTTIISLTLLSTLVTLVVILCRYRRRK